MNEIKKPLKEVMPGKLFEQMRSVKPKDAKAFLKKRDESFGIVEKKKAKEIKK